MNGRIYMFKVINFIKYTRGVIMKNNILKKIMITGLISTVPVSGVFIGNLTTNNAKTLNTSYAATIKDTAYSATGKTNVKRSCNKLH